MNGYSNIGSDGRGLPYSLGKLLYRMCLWEEDGSKRRFGMKYEKPSLEKIEIIDRVGEGACSPGSRDSGICSLGSKAATTCNTGSVATGYCSFGSSHP